VGFAEKIQAQLGGNAAERKRREEILRDLLQAFAEGGEEATASALKRRMEEIERRFYEALGRLNEKL
jgi:hypothetical protein